MELLVVVFLGSLLLTVLLRITYNAARATARGTSRIELLQFANHALTNLRLDLQSSTPRGILGGPTTPIAIQPVVDVTSSGRQVWATELLVYHLDTAQRQLVRTTWTPASVTTTAPAEELTPAEILLVTTTPDLARRIMAPEVQEFEINWEDGVARKLPLTSRILLTRPQSRGPALSLVIERKITLRSHYQ